MKDTRNLAIGTLATTAVVLFAAFTVVQNQPIPALASGMTVSGGRFLVTVGAFAQADEEFVYIIDVPEQKLGVYRFDTNRREIQIIQGIDLAEARKVEPVGGLPRRP